MQFYRGKDYDISDEIQEIQEKRLHKLKSNPESSSNVWKWTVRRIFSMAYFRPFSCIGLLCIFRDNTKLHILLKLHFLKSQFFKLILSIDRLYILEWFQKFQNFQKTIYHR